MKFLKVAGLCLASMLALGMALAGTASATALWLLCLKGSNAGNTKYETNQCNKVGTGTKEWESVSIGTKSDTVRAVAESLRLEDAKGELGAAVIVKCNEVKGGEGLIQGDEIIINEATAPHPSSECTAEGTGLFKACKTTTLEKVEGTDLPWKVEISVSGGIYTGKIKSDGNGEPGWNVKCSGVEDKCTSEPGKEEETKGESGVTTGGVLLVLAEFQDHPGNCSVGGKEQGHVQGFTAILLASGNGLMLHET